MNHKYQNGAVLIISMLLLLVMSILGISMLQVSLITGQISHNDETLMIAFNQAERTLRDGENEVITLEKETGLTDFNNNDQHLYLAPTKQQSIKWLDGKSAGNDAQGRYAIIYHGARALDSESATIKPDGGISGSNIYLTYVIAKSNINATRARKLIRSSIATLKQP